MPRIHRVVPITMGCSLLLGVLFAVGHHQFYHFLNERIVGSDDQQQWFLRIGAGFAFVVKTTLTAAVELAYTQILWRILSSRPISIKGIDSFFSVVNDAWHFRNGEIYRKGPALALVAVIMWTLPLVALITPATLTVQQAPQPREDTKYLPIPTINYNTSQNSRWALKEVSALGALPSYRTQRIAHSVASQGSILRITAPYPNCSYIVEFYGPSLSCGPLETMVSYIQANALDQILSWKDIYYVAWVPEQNLHYGNETLASWTLTGLNKTLNPASTSELTCSCDRLSNDRMRLFIYTRGSTHNISECGLYNASYTANFTFSNGQQKIRVVNKTLLNSVESTANLSTDVDLYVQNEAISQPYVSLMGSLNQLLLGFISGVDDFGLVYSTTQMPLTVLSETSELQAFLSRASNVPNDIVSTSGPLKMANMTMIAAVEELFLNMTLSLFGDSYFLKQSTDLTPITVYTPQNMYVYDSSHLLMTYGIGIFICSIIVVIGFLCIWISTYTFGSSFSAILRTTRNREIDGIVKSGDTVNTDKLSESLGKRKLILKRQGKRDNGGNGNSNGKVEKRVYFAVCGNEDRDRR